MIRWLAFVVCLLCLTCAQPVPPPVPGPGTDIFYGQVFDCRSDVVASQRLSAAPLVTACLASATPTSCLVSLVGNEDIATVACGIRDLAMETTAASNAGTVTEEQKIIETNANIFITTEMLGYR
jgi:hypothetical protein